MSKNTFTLFILLLISAGMANAAESKLVLDIAFERNIPALGGINHLQSMTRKVRVDFDEKTPLSLENGWVLEILAKDEGAATALNFTVLDSAGPDATVLATPGLLAPLEQVSTVRWNNAEEKLSLSVKPLKPDNKLGQ
jgi:hypothetical protein